MFPRLIVKLCLVAAIEKALEANGHSITITNLHGNYQPGDLIFEDDFDYFDLETWSHELTFGENANWEFQMYTNTRINSFAENGSLFIKPTLTTETHGEATVFRGGVSLDGNFPVDSCTNPAYLGCNRKGNYPHYILNPVMSAKIRTVNSFYFQYGRIDVRAKLPGGDWMWPTISLLPRFNTYGTWPASGGIQIVESRGNQKLYASYGNGKSFGSNKAFSGLHFGPYTPYNGYEVTRTESEDEEGFDADYHLYSVEWTNESISFLLDNVTVNKVQPPEGGFYELGDFDQFIPNPWQFSEESRIAPFDQKFFIAINLAVGGTNDFFPDDCWSGEERKKKPWTNSNTTGGYLTFYCARDDWLPTWEGERGALAIDYVRVYAV